MNLKNEILYTKFNRNNTYNLKHISSQFTKPDYKKPIMENSKPLQIAPIKDKDGLSEAYKRESKLYVNGDTIYIGGTSSINDVYDDLKIPLRLTANSKRYKDALELLRTNKDIKNISSHSLGGSVALELQKNLPERNLNVNTYGAPVLSVTPSTNRFRNFLDPVSILDFGANSSVNIGLNPHNYSNNDNNMVSKNMFETYSYRTDS